MRRLPLIAAFVALSSCVAFGQVAACPAATQRADSAADAAYAAGRYAEAEGLYTRELSERPHDVPITAALIHSMLHQGEVAEALAVVDRLLPEDPHSAALLTALAEVQLRRGQPWLAVGTLDSAADPCYARTHLIRSRIFRLDSMYASERREIESAYQIDPKDPDIGHAWRTIVKPAKEVESIQASLASMKDLDADIRQKAEASATAMLPLLSENSQTCKVLPAEVSATLPLLPSMQDGKHIDGYKLDVQLPRGKVKLLVDTAASGLYISQALADANGLQPGAHDPAGTVRADSVHIGPLEFRDCLIGVSEAPFANNMDGFIGTDIFSSYLITLDHPQARLRLDPLPQTPGPLPGDRSTEADLRNYQPVYHRLQYLLVPVTLNNKDRRLFVLDSGIRFSTMPLDVAHAVSTTKINFTNPMQTVSGSTLQLYRDSFDFEFANLSARNQGHIVEFDPSAIERNAGLKIGGMIGFDMLHSLTMHLDYRDGLVEFDSSDAAIAPVRGSAAGSASYAAALAAKASECPTDQAGDRPVNTTIEAATTGLLDSGHLKAGEQISVKVLREWLSPSCRLPEGAILYGRVTAAKKASGASELALAFDRGDCFGQGKKQLPLQIIGVVASPDERKPLHSVLPSEVAGVRNISSVAASMGNAADQDLNPGGTPNTVHPGIVVGLPRLKLEPVAGPSCSARISSLESSVRLGPGTELLLTMGGATP